MKMLYGLQINTNVRMAPSVYPYISVISKDNKMSLLKQKAELELELAELKTQQALLSFPTPLRWALIFCLIAILPGYIIAKKLSYNYWTKSYSQYLIAAKPSFSDPQNPKVGDAAILNAGSGFYSAVITVTNPNLDLSLAKTKYDIIFLNRQNEEVYRDSDEIFLLPDQKKTIIVPRFASTDEIAKTEFNFKEELRWQKKASIPSVNISTVVERTYSQIDPNAFVTEGYYTNPGSTQLGQVRLNFFIYSISGKLIGVSRRDDFSLNPGERRAFKQLWPNLYVESGAKVTVTAETNVLDPSNLIPVTTPGSPASDLDRP